MELTRKELDTRRLRFIAAMDAAFPDWDTALIVSKVNQYYFTGTMQDALLIIKKDKSMSYYVRRSFERANDESPLAKAPSAEALPFSGIKTMHSYRDAAQIEGSKLGNTYLETDVLTISVLQRLQKYFDMRKVYALDNIVRTVRAVKSPYELYWIKKSALLHCRLMEEIPSILKEGISEAEMLAEISRLMYRMGYQGLTRFYRFQTEIAPGQLGFSENTLYPASFDGPGASKGNSPAAPLAASTDRRLKKGDLVFADLGFGINGYHSDKTLVFMFGSNPPKEAANAHRLCIDIEKRTAERLRPGEIPSKIYADIMNSLTDEMKNGFMGIKNHGVAFLGHGVGLHIDELPVIAKGFDAPLEENMVISLEPKKAVPGTGMTGVEETYLVTKSGGLCLTGGSREIIVV